MEGGAVVGKAAEDNSAHRRRFGQRIHRRGDRDVSRAMDREVIDAGGNGRKSNRGKATRLAQLDGSAIARCQRLVLALASAAPDGSDRMNHMLCRQPISRSDFGIAGRAAIQLAAFGEKLRAGGAMDHPIHPTATEQ